MLNQKQTQYVRDFLRITPDISRLNGAIDVFSRRTTVDLDVTTQHLTKMRDKLVSQQESHPLAKFLDSHVPDSK